MIAKAAGLLAGVLVMALWFWLIGTQPVLETVVGLLLGIASGIWAWVAIDRRMHPRNGGSS